MKSQVLHTVWCGISGEAAGEIGDWSPLGVKGLRPPSPSPCAVPELRTVLAVMCRDRTWVVWPVLICTYHQGYMLLSNWWCSCDNQCVSLSPFRRASLPVHAVKHQLWYETEHQHSCCRSVQKTVWTRSGAFVEIENLTDAKIIFVRWILSLKGW